MDTKSVYAPLFSMPDSGWQPEHTLWVCVVGQAIIDAASTDPEVRQEVREWVDHEDFELVCGMAQMNPRAVSDIVTKILNEPNCKKAFRQAMNVRFLLRNFLESQMGEVDLTKAPRE